MLAAGMTQAAHQQAEKIRIEKTNPALMEKYLRWKIWLDGLLQDC